MYLNQVYLDNLNLRRYRVVWENLGFCMAIDIDDESAWPIQFDIDDLLNPEQFSLISEPFVLPSVEIGSVSAERRDEAYRAISHLLENYTLLFNKATRNKLIREQLEKTDKPRIYILRQLRRYWKRGMAPDALAPDYEKCGGAGTPRRNVKNKLGRKRKNADGEGIIITDEVADLFRLAIDGFYLKNEKVNLKDAKDRAVGFYKSRYPKADKTSIPTLSQFKYFYKTNYQTTHVLKARTPQIQFNKDTSPLTSTSAYLNFGPGARYEIDATIVDLYLVSGLDRNHIVGRPVIYYVKDVFSRMVVGLYVGLENPSWATATIALANAFSDKVKYCQQFGIEIDSSMWPSVGIPATITADRGEMLGRQADVLVNRLGISLTNTRAYRGSDKGVVERAFKEMHAHIKPYAQGVVEPLNGKKRIGHRYELDAELTLTAFTKIVIHHVINHNTIHVVKEYDFAPDMPTDLASKPIDLWYWGVKNRTGKLRVVDEELAFINMLPQGKATVSVTGIKFNGMSYTCSEAMQLGWFHRSKSVTRPESVDISYDPRDTNVIYLRPDTRFDSYWICLLSDKSRRYRDITFAEAKLLLSQAKKTEATNQQQEDFQAPDLQQEIMQIVKQERDKKAQSPSSQSNTEKLRGIRENRNAEKELERQKNRDEQADKSTKPELAPVVPIRSSDSDESFDFPDLDSFLEDDDE
ncbi:DDE-type integrase/transposase/recombinase [Vibrio parahaemolyticus]|uniref:Mu transposase C-terminal domain-containing protein n=1 Tax=Vibrio parahaemolyticus TaxID=670 RepID=UPI0019374B08|nr:Mu transposase C-terminal domain-containing protein [Vibrio parahaemolyticus]QQC98996.1 DDE-type integrase/transposase/recombinase [Vibrio parahaemolyticus]